MHRFSFMVKLNWLYYCWTWPPIIFIPYSSSWLTNYWRVLPIHFFLCSKTMLQILVPVFNLIFTKNNKPIFLRCQIHFINFCQAEKLNSNATILSINNDIIMRFPLLKTHSFFFPQINAYFILHTDILLWLSSFLSFFH